MMNPKDMYSATAHYLSGLSADEVLQLVGLARKRSIGSWMLPALAFLGAGVMVGLAAGFLFAQGPGTELRESLKRKAGDFKGEVSKRFHPHGVAHAAPASVS